MKTFFATLLAVIALAVSPALAADASLIGTTKIAVVNIQTIMRDATAAKSAREQLEAKHKAYQAEISKKEDSLQKEEEELAKQRSALAKEAFEQKAKAFREKATVAQKEVASKKAVLDNAYESSLQQIHKAMTDIISELAKEKGFVVALPTPILYADPALDISADVLDRLNKQLPKINVKFDAPAAAAAPAKKESKQ